jgi:HTH-type transcriptional regulator / antitoxin HipB
MLTIASMTTNVFTSLEMGQVIRRVRRERNLTQTELALRANVARGALQKLEEGRGTVNLETVFKILQTLSLDLNVAPRRSANAEFLRENQRDG